MQDNYTNIVRDIFAAADVSRFINEGNTIDFTFVISENSNTDKLAELIEDLCNEREMDITEAVASPIFEGAKMDENFHRYDVTLTSAYED